MPQTDISALGEFKLIEKLTNDINYIDQSILKGVGDDSAVVANSFPMLVTTDMLAEGIHFDLAYVPLKHLGYKAVAVNVSDICAMNATPKYITVSIAISNRFSVEAIEELYAGIYLACKAYNITLIGGDTCSSKSGLVISITCLGEQDPTKIVYRSGAKVDDLLCVTGDLGAAYLGLQLLEREKQVYLEDPNMQPNLLHAPYLLQRQLKPEARLDIIKQLQEKDVQPSAMIDVSDGLSSEILHLSKHSQVGFNLLEDRIPIHDECRQQAFEFGIDATLCAMSGGEDYELLFTIAPSDYNKIMLAGDISVIGQAVPLADGNHLVTKSGVKHPLSALGWNAFSGTENL
jgi:thiamine-monophosphate kinase